MGQTVFYKEAHHNIFYPTCHSYNVMLTTFPLSGKCYVPSPWTWVDTCNFFKREYNESEALWLLRLYQKKAKHFHLTLLGCLLLNLSHNATVEIKQPHGEALCSGSGWPTEVLAKSQHQLVSHVSEPPWKWILQTQSTALVDTSPCPDAGSWTRSMIIVLNY